MKKIYIQLFLVFFSLGNLNITVAQTFHRFSADYTVKYNDKNGNAIMKMGRVYYDSKQKQIVIKNGFPVKEYIIHKDTSIYFIRVGNIVNQLNAISPTEFSIFHLALNGELLNYGLDKAGYTIGNIKKDKGLIIASWLPPEKYKFNLGKIIISTKNKKLYGIIFLDINEKIIGKHIFQKFINIDGFEFPTEVIRINYYSNYELYEKTTYKKFKINETGKDEYYNYVIPNK